MRLEMYANIKQVISTMPPRIPPSVPQKSVGWFSNPESKFIPKIPDTSAPLATAKLSTESHSSSLLTSKRRAERDTEMDSSRSRVFSRSLSASLWYASHRCRWYSSMPSTSSSSAYSSSWVRSLPLREMSRPCTSSSSSRLSSSSSRSAPARASISTSSCFTRRRASRDLAFMADGSTRISSSTRFVLLASFISSSMVASCNAASTTSSSNRNSAAIPESSYAFPPRVLEEAEPSALKRGSPGRSANVLSLKCRGMPVEWCSSIWAECMMRAPVHAARRAVRASRKRAQYWRLWSARADTSGGGLKSTQ
mmetsp:Transcript_47161/g.90043  ORF Transcript_47161/g.90043 Transcript_47161/m.90043 type:complete len:309 (+) Transcript_47161:381-1307(+)